MVKWITISLVGLALIAQGCAKQQTQQVDREVKEAGKIAQRSVENTAEAVRKGAPEAKAKLEEAADQAVEKGSQMAQVAVATSSVKNAIADDPVTGNKANKIDVDTNNGRVYITGHVASEAAKKQAVKLAKAALKEKRLAYEVVDELAIRKPPK